MFVSEKVHELLDLNEEESHAQAVAILEVQLQPLRDRRKRVMDVVTKSRATAKKNKGLKKAGIKTPEQLEAEMLNEQFKQKFRERQKAKLEGGADEGETG